MEQLNALGDSVDFHIQYGDFGYADDRPQVDFEEIWNIFQTKIQNWTARYPYMTSPGNHEAACSAVTGSIGCQKPHDNFTSYRNRFRMPSVESGSDGGNMWYSFNYSYAHFVSIDTETSYKHSPEGEFPFNDGPFGDQLTWLEADLARANSNRHLQPWLIVMGHRPLYSTVLVQDPPFIISTVRDTFEALFVKYNVDLYICGHVHAYERMWPVYDSKRQQKNYTDPKVPVYLIAGNAGNVEGHTSDWDIITPDYLAFRNDDEYGYGILDVINSTTLSWVLHSANNNSVIDSIQLIKNHS